MNIKQFAELSGFSSDTLRYYEKIGLFGIIERDDAGYRTYSEKDLEWAIFLNRLKSTGMSLKKIRYFAELRKEGDSTITARRKMLEEHQIAVNNHINNSCYAVTLSRS